MRKAKSLRNIIVVLVSNLKPGETVKIYEDPWTQKKLEGEAKLIERLQQDSDREYWLVEFTDSHERHPRWIKKKTSTSPTEELYDENVDFDKLLEQCDWDKERFEAKLAQIEKTLPKTTGITSGTGKFWYRFNEWKREADYVSEHHSEGSKPKTICSKLQDAIEEEQKAVDEYEELWKELDRLGQKGYATGIIRIAEEERSHRDTLKRIKEVMCP